MCKFRNNPSTHYCTACMHAGHWLWSTCRITNVYLLQCVLTVCIISDFTDIIERLITLSDSRVSLSSTTHNINYVLFIGKTVVRDSMIRFCVSPKGILSTSDSGSIKATIYGLFSNYPDKRHLRYIVPDKSWFGIACMHNSL